MGIDLEPFDCGLLHALEPSTDLPRSARRTMSFVSGAGTRRLSVSKRCLRIAMLLFVAIWGLALGYQWHHAHRPPVETEAELLGRYKREYDEMRVEYCADWKE